MFKKECNKRHLKRSDVKNNDSVLLKIEKFKDLLEAIKRKNADTTRYDLDEMH